MNLNDVLDICRTLAPEEIALPGDPVGQLIGTETPHPITTVGVCLDATPVAVQQAVDAGAELLIAHHPLIYAPLKAILPATDPVSRAAALLVKNDMSLYAMHTNWDRATDGINDTLAALLGLGDVEPLGANGEHTLPRLGNLSSSLPLAEFLRFVENTLACTGTNVLRVNSIDRQKLIRRVAVCGGAGAAMAQDVQAAGADVYVTSDVRHHEFWYAEAQGLALVDAGHDATETPGMRALAILLGEQMPDVKIVWCGIG